MSENMVAADTTALMETLLSAVTGEIWLDLSGVADEEEFALELQLRIKEGVVLIGAGALEDVTGQAMSGMEWFGVDMTDGLEDILSEAGLGGEMEWASTSTAEMEAAEAAATTITRLPDSEVNA